MMLAMKTTAEFANASVHHDHGVMSGGHSGLHPSFRICPSYLLADQLVSREVGMEEGDAAALVGWSGGVGLPLMF